MGANSHRHQPNRSITCNSAWDCSRSSRFSFCHSSSSSSSSSFRSGSWLSEWLGCLYVIVVGADKLALAMNIRFLSPAARAIRVAFRWVLTFGGIARSQAEREARAATIRRQ